MIVVVENPKNEKSFKNLRDFADKSNIRLMEVIMFNEEEALQRQEALTNDIQKMNLNIEHLKNTLKKYTDILSGADDIGKKKNKK